MIGELRGYCIQNKQADTICTSPTCIFPSLQCSKQNCSCTVAHQICFTSNIKLKLVMNRILKNIQKLKKPYKQAAQCCEEMIKILLIHQKQFERKAESYQVLNQDEQKFISKMNYEQSSKIKGSEVTKIISGLKQEIDNIEWEKRITEALNAGKDMILSFFVELEATIKMSKITASRKQIDNLKQTPFQNQLKKSSVCSAPLNVKQIEGGFPSQLQVSHVHCQLQNARLQSLKIQATNTLNTSNNTLKLTKQEVRQQISKFLTSKIVLQDNIRTYSNQNYQPSHIIELNIVQVDKYLIEVLGKHCPNLQTLTIGANGNCNFNDECVDKLVAELPNIKVLKILNSYVTDNGALKIASRMKNLEYLSLKQNVLISDKVMIQIKKMLPYCKLIYGMR